MLYFLRKRVILKGFAVFIIVNFLLILTIISINQANVKPSNVEIYFLQNKFGKLTIHNKRDLISIQNKVVKEIKHEFNGSDEIVVKDIIISKKGFCYDRSLILQKIFILNKIPIRPVYIFFNSQKKNTDVLDFFYKNIQSHNVFEFKYNNNWYVLKTNNTMEEFQTLEQYISSGSTVPSSSKFVKYLNNRNSKFIYPSYIPDIYFFN
jgi:hypothetical protein